MLRTHTCGELNKSHVDQTVTLCGWVHRRRDHGKLIFIDIRDRYGLTQIVFIPKMAPEAHKIASGLGLEFVVKENENLRLKIRELEDALHSACARVEVERGITKDYRATLGHLEGGAGCQGVKKDFLGCPIATVADKDK